MAVAETKSCECCGNPVTRTKSQQDNRKYWTCNRSCSSKLAISLGRTPNSWGENPYRGLKETRPCNECGKDVTRYLAPRRIDRPWFCSFRCRARYSLNKRMEEKKWRGLDHFA